MSGLRDKALGIAAVLLFPASAAAAENTAYGEGGYGAGNFGGLSFLAATGPFWLGLGSAIILCISAGLFVWLRTRRRTAGK